MLAIFDALQEAVLTPGYRGCAFANANAEALPGSVEANALRAFRDWLADVILAQTQEAGFFTPPMWRPGLRLLYDGAVANSQLDKHPDAVRLARELAQGVLETSPRA